MIHYLKTHPDEYRATYTKEKTFELRKNDRNFKVHDILCLRRFDPEKGYDGACCYVQIQYILMGGKFGLSAEYVAMSIKVLEYDQNFEIQWLDPR